MGIFGASIRSVGFLNIICTVPRATLRTIPFAPIPLTFDSLGIIKDDEILSNLQPIRLKAPDAGLAIVDLATMKMASIKGNDLGFVASLVKVGVAIAAYRLREAVRQFASQSLAQNPSDLISEIEKAWKPIISTIFKKDPKSDFPKSDFPKLDKIFSFTAPTPTDNSWKIEFTSNTLGIVNWDTMDGFTPGEKQAGSKTCREGLGMKDKMFLMLNLSNNAAANYCIQYIGFQYLQGAIEMEGFKILGGLGIWIGKNFDLSSPSWKASPRGVGTVQLATPNGLIMLLVALETKKLISPDGKSENIDACDEIIKMLTNSSHFLTEILRNAGRTTKVKYAKDGAAGLFMSEIDVCVKSNTKRFGAVLVKVNGETAFDKAALEIVDLSLRL